MSLYSFISAHCPAILKPLLDTVGQSTLGRRLSAGVFWSIVGTVVSRGLMLVSSVLIARMLGLEVFGEFGMVRSTVTMFVVFAGFGLGLTATKHVAEFRESAPERAGDVIVLSWLVAAVTGAVIGIALMIGAPWLAEKSINAPHLTGVLRIGSIILFFSALTGAQTGALSGFEAFKTIARVNLFVGLLSFPVMIIGAYTGGLYGAVWALAINTGFHWLLNHFALCREMKRFNITLSLRNCGRERPMLWRFSLPAVLSGVMVGPAGWVCNAILVNQLGGYAALGIFTAAFQVSLLIATANGIVGQVFLPICATTFEKKTPRFDFINIIFPWCVGIFLSLPFMCIPELWSSLFGGEYAGESMNVTTVLVLMAAIIIAHRQGIARNFIARGLMWWSLLSNSFWAICTIALSWLFRHNGAEGRAAAYLLAYLANTVVFIPLYIRMGLCSRDLLLSRYSMFIWAVLAVSVLLVPVWDLNIYYRTAFLGVSYAVIAWLVYRLWKFHTDQMRGQLKPTALERGSVNR
jgi:O-antigen/teichoic acid export membrane protein